MRADKPTYCLTFLYEEDTPAKTSQLGKWVFCSLQFGISISTVPYTFTHLCCQFEPMLSLILISAQQMALLEFVLLTTLCCCVV